MIQKTKILILFLTLSLFSVKHVAADATADDFQVCGNGTALGNFGAINPNNPDLKRFRWWMEGQGRFGIEASQFTQALIRQGLGDAITDKIVVWAGYAWAPTAEPLAFRPFNEHRIWEQVTWADNLSFGRLSLRSRFELLAEEHSFDPRQKEPRKQHYLLRVGQIREKLTKSLVARKMNKTSPLISVILRPDFPETFAALGAEKTGASLDEIIARTRFHRAKVERLIDDLVHVGLAERDSRNKNVKPLALALEGFDLQNSDFFKKDFFRSLEKAKIRFEKQADSDGSLFMTQTFSVKGDQLPIFKRKLSDLVNDFASNAGSDRSDTIAEICISFRRFDQGSYQCARIVEGFDRRSRFQRCWPRAFRQ